MADVTVYTVFDQGIGYRGLGGSPAYRRKSQQLNAAPGGEQHPPKRLQ
jgi:hypothetical protein